MATNVVSSLSSSSQCPRCPAWSEGEGLSDRAQTPGSTCSDLSQGRIRAAQDTKEIQRAPRHKEEKKPVRGLQSITSMSRRQSGSPDGRHVWVQAQESGAMQYGKEWV